MLGCGWGARWSSARPAQQMRVSLALHKGSHHLDSRWPEEHSAHFPEGSLKHKEQAQFPRALEGMDTYSHTPAGTLGSLASGVTPTLPSSWSPDP